MSLVDYPYMSLIGRADAAVNPISKKDEAFPYCAGDCKSPYEADAAHQPGLAYLPYLVTGDYYYLEELQFWTMFNLFRTNPGYRAKPRGSFYALLSGRFTQRKPKWRPTSNSPRCSPQC